MSTSAPCSAQQTGMRWAEALPEAAVPDVERAAVVLGRRLEAPGQGGRRAVVWPAEVRRS